MLCRWMVFFLMCATATSYAALPTNPPTKGYSSGSKSAPGQPVQNPGAGRPGAGPASSSGTQLPQQRPYDRPGEYVPSSLNAIYGSPGVVTQQGGAWVGSENLYNLSSNVGLDVEIIQPQAVALPITREAIIGKLSALLRNGGVNVRTNMGGSPLPFLHVLVMIQPIEKGFVAYCAVRLFEEVEIDRVHFKPGLTWQTISWEKQELIVSPPEQLDAEINKTLSDMILSFTDRLKQKPDHR
ncbi:MAG: hypothetical protein H0X51_01615 [Parachlamydiaceae bacterium]|nr:hypothetical protein [Parachlamydiaceae bacterium]